MPIVDYRSSFRKGLEAQSNRELTRSVLFDLIRELRSQVLLETEGKIFIATNPGVEDGFIPLKGDLIACRGHRKVTLATFSLSERGWPVRFEYANLVWSPVDCPMSFETLLASMLEHPITGGKLQALLGERQ